TGRRTGSSVAGRNVVCSRATSGAASARPGSAPGPIVRFLRTSTVTVFERPCEKLWRTCPVSTLLRSSSLPPVRVRVRGRFCSCSFALVISIKHHHLLSRTPSGLHGEVYQCFRPKAGDLF